MRDARWLLIVDYNGDRVDDVRRMTRHAADAHGARSILMRAAPSEVDRAAADVAVELDPLRPSFADEAFAALAALPGRVVAVAPFSDRSVPGATRLADRLGVGVDDPTLAAAGWSKLEYRARERSIADLCRAQRIFVPDARAVGSLDQLRAFAEEHPRGVVLKPACEGNNRGVVRLSRGDDLEAAFAEVASYRGGGLVAEELIPFEDEYSFDGLGHLSFVTKKTSARGRYPVERGQTVGATLPPATIAAVSRAGTIANLLVGQRGGPFHNEVKHDPATGECAVVEPNRRPGGMRIWHLARRVHGVDLFHLWVDRLLGGALPTRLPSARGVAAMRALASPCDGVLDLGHDPRGAAEAILHRTVEALRRSSGPLDAEVEWFDFKLRVASGEAVRAEQVDNAAFVAEVCAFAPRDEAFLEPVLDRFEAAFARAIGAHVRPGAVRRTGS